MQERQPYPYPTDPTHTDRPENASTNHGGSGHGIEPPVTRPGYLRDDERVASLAAHLSAPVAAIISVGWVSFLGPLIVWLMYRNSSPAVRRAAAGAFNFNIAFSVLYVIGWILLFSVIGLPVALLLWGVIFVVATWCHLKGALRSMRGETYDYPFQIRLLS